MASSLWGASHYNPAPFVREATALTTDSVKFKFFIRISSISLSVKLAADL